MNQARDPGVGTGQDFLDGRGVVPTVIVPVTAPAPPAPAPTSGLAVAGFLVGVAGLGVSLWAVLGNRKTRRQLRARNADADEWLRTNYDHWRGQERAAAKGRRAARRAKRAARGTT